VRGLNRLFHRRGGCRSENTDGIDVFDEDWDTLILLDACRYDMFESTSHLDGTLCLKESKGSSTSEWLRANVDGRDLLDTVYVTANPQLERNRDTWDVNLHQTINVWLDEGWDEETGTVLAETMTDAAIKAYERFPNKRLVVHYMQPHYPFVSSDTAFDKDHLNSIDVEGSTVEGENVWGQKFTGQLPVSDDKLWSMYVDNLEYVLEHVETVLDAIPGKAVVTSDHGNYVGERASPIPIREYGHPRGLYDDTVVHVPWLVHELGSRRETYLNKGEQSKANTDQELVAERLRALGYQE
jgi:hypothetical protein